MIRSIPVDEIEFNEYNSRFNYTTKSIEKMAMSIAANGMLTPVKVRPSLRYPGKYELVFGHRRYLASKKLGLESIRAELVETSNEEMIRESLVENLEREELSDYEKAVIFDRLNREFGRTYEEIGKWIGLSKQHICSYIAMLRLFDAQTLSANPELLACLKKITEHHARILSRVAEDERANLTRLIVEEDLSVRELSRIIARLRSWFTEREEGEISGLPFEDKRMDPDQKEIRKIVFQDLIPAHEIDFDSYKQVHLYGEGFDMFPSYPATGCFENNKAQAQEQRWFYEILPKLRSEIKNLKVRVMGSAALATFIVSYSGRYRNKVFDRSVRCSMVLVKKTGSWKILHEHWSRLERPMVEEQVNRKQDRAIEHLISH